jgi:hypothetical protein
MVRTLWDILGEIEDRRGRQGRQYALRSVCAVLCSGQGAVDMALFAKAKEQRRPQAGKTACPSHDTPELADGEPTVPAARSGPVPGCFSAFHGGVFQAMSGRSGH